MTIYIVFDKKGIIHESEDYGDALKEFEKVEKFEGDLIFCEELGRRH